MRGRTYCGYCAAKQEQFFGWRLHLVCTPARVPVRFTLVPGALHDLSPIHELTVDLPAGARVFGDKGYNSAADEASILAATQVRLIPVRRANMQPHAWFVDDLELRGVSAYDRDRQQSVRGNGLAAAACSHKRRV